MIYSSTCTSPVGELTMASDGEHLLGLWIEGQKYAYGTLSETPAPRDGLAVFDQTKDWLRRYFTGAKPTPAELPLAPIGGAFRQGVWKILTEIPYGQVTTYGTIAAQMAAAAGKARMSAQAVGGAVGHNPISIIVPCHRVVGVNGSLTGYAGGIHIKQRLLEHEGVDMSGLFVPKKGTAL